jgi:hypothetical protein
MRRTPVLLTSCVRCARLHVPTRRDAAHPLCPRCTLPQDAPAPVPGRGRGRASQVSAR